jgi:hypothetical protein
MIDFSFFPYSVKGIIRDAMNKRKLHHVWTKLRLVKPWYLLVIAVISTVVCIFALRANNEHMAKLRTAVYAADKDNSNVQGALDKLQAYVTAHMNTNLSAGPNAVYPPIQLKYTYSRLEQAQAAANTDQSNTQLYTDAQTYCQQQDPVDFSGHNRVPCIEQYVESHGGTAVPPTPVPDALYEFSFASPKWSPDLAGWSLLMAVVSWLLFACSFIAKKWFQRYIA